MSQRFELPIGYYDSAISAIEATVEFFRSVGDGTKLTADFEACADYFDKDGISESHTIKVQVRYSFRSGGRYVLSEWRPVYQILNKSDDSNAYGAIFHKRDEPWRKISDHDSCWKYNHRDVSDYMSAFLKSNLEWESFEFSIKCERVNIEPSD